jgi:hypothetical protein
MTRTSPIADTRRFTRHTVGDVRVRVRLAPCGAVRDLGLGGVLLEVHQDYRPNEVYSLRLEGGASEPISLLGRVVRCFPETPPGHPEPRWVAAIAFELVSDKTREQLRHVVASCEHLEGSHLHVAAAS